MVASYLPYVGKKTKYPQLNQYATEETTLLQASPPKIQSKNKTPTWDHFFPLLGTPRCGPDLDVVVVPFAPLVLVFGDVWEGEEFVGALLRIGEFEGGVWG